MCGELVKHSSNKTQNKLLKYFWLEKSWHVFFLLTCCPKHKKRKKKCRLRLIAESFKDFQKIGLVCKSCFIFSYLNFKAVPYGFRDNSQTHKIFVKIVIKEKTNQLRIRQMISDMLTQDVLTKLVFCYMAFLSLNLNYHLLLLNGYAGRLSFNKSICVFWRK